MEERAINTTGQGRKLLCREMPEGRSRHRSNMIESMEVKNEGTLWCVEQRSINYGSYDTSSLLPAFVWPVYKNFDL